MLRIPAVVAACAAVLLVASACTDDEPDPNFSSVSATATPTPTPSSPDPTATPNTTANTSPGESAPTPPPGAAVQTSDGALQFTAYYWRTLDWAYATNTAAVLDGLFADSCESCSSFRSSIETDVGAGYALIGGRITIRSITKADLAGGSVPAEFAFDVQLSVQALEERTNTGVIATSYPAADSNQRTYLGWSGSQWTVVNTAQVQQ